MADKEVGIVVDGVHIEVDRENVSLQLTKEVEPEPTVKIEVERGVKGGVRRVIRIYGMDEDAMIARIKEIDGKILNAFKPTDTGTE